MTRKYDRDDPLGDGIIPTVEESAPDRLADIEDWDRWDDVAEVLLRRANAHGLRAGSDKDWYNTHELCAHQLYGEHVHDVHRALDELSFDSDMEISGWEDGMWELHEPISTAERLVDAGDVYTGWYRQTPVGITHEVQVPSELVDRHAELYRRLVLLYIENGQRPVHTDTVRGPDRSIDETLLWDLEDWKCAHSVREQGEFVGWVPEQVRLHPVDRQEMMEVRPLFP